MLYKTITSIAVSYFLAACSIMPYESEFGCRLKDNYGKCASMEEAYQEAVTGEPQGKIIRPASQNNYSEPERNTTQTGLHEETVMDQQPYPAYRDTVYSELSTLIEKPQTPMLRPPKTIRTLVLSYSPGNRKQVLYMPRYVFSVIEESEWVLGQYLNKKPELINNIVDTGSIEK